ncbi:hypothetical protein LMH73_009860 [Vibrio splendidus]|nr:hypothetical protein [Vibrio splendidus]MCC4883043.1 hypothetical protein [Vibrio splendidus]
MKKSNKALRIHHSERMKKKAFKKLFGTWFLPSCTEGNELAIKAAMASAGRLRNHMASCSCHMCGNPRRHYGNRKEALTMQEKKQLANFASFDI